MTRVHMRHFWLQMASVKEHGEVGARHSLVECISAVVYVFTLEEENYGHHTKKYRSVAEHCESRLER